MSNKNGTTQTYTVPNPLLIDFIVLSETQDGKAQIELWTASAQYKSLTLPTYQWGELVKIGVNPNNLRQGKKYHTAFNAVWEEGKKTNNKGNKYKNIARLEQIPTQAETAIIDGLQLQTDLLTIIASNQYGSRNAMIKAYKELIQSRCKK